MCRLNFECTCWNTHILSLNKCLFHQDCLLFVTNKMDNNSRRFILAPLPAFHKQSPNKTDYFQLQWLQVLWFHYSVLIRIYCWTREISCLLKIEWRMQGHISTVFFLKIISGFTRSSEKLVDCIKDTRSYNYKINILNQVTCVYDVVRKLSFVANAYRNRNC